MLDRCKCTKKNFTISCIIHLIMRNDKTSVRFSFTSNTENTCKDEDDISTNIASNYVNLPLLAFVFQSAVLHKRFQIWMEVCAR